MLHKVTPICVTNKVTYNYRNNFSFRGLCQYYNRTKTIISLSKNKSMKLFQKKRLSRGCDFFTL
jgi:hypothetical protein